MFKWLRRGRSQLQPGRIGELAAMQLCQPCCHRFVIDVDMVRRQMRSVAVFVVQTREVSSLLCLRSR